MIYEVDNRYPEIAEPIEKIRGVKRHGALIGGRSLAAEKRALRINNLKRSFWTSATAVVTAISLLLVSPGGNSEAVEPEPFRAPTVSIVSAAQSQTQADELEYRYRVELNDAESADVTVAARTEDGEPLGEAGPFRHTQTETSQPLVMLLSRTEDLSRVELDVTCTYVREGETRETHAVELVEIRRGPPEPVTEPPTEPVTQPTEPDTEPTEPPTEPTEPFLAPTLAITEAELNGTDVTPLRYRYEITLNSAESLWVTASVTSETGASLGSDGPYDHGASGESPARSTALSWAARPTSVTLTLTGAYTEDGEEKTVTATQTLNVQKAPFTAPVLTISSAELNGTDVTPLRYRYEVTLNSAESLRVTASVTSETGASLGSGGPYDHDASGKSKSHSAALSWTTRPTSVTLTLTGT